MAILQSTTEEFSEFGRPWDKDSKASGFNGYLESEENTGRGVGFETQRKASGEVCVTRPASTLIDGA